MSVLCLYPDSSDLWALTPHVAGQEESERDVLVVLVVPRCKINRV